MKHYFKDSIVSSLPNDMVQKHFNFIRLTDEICSQLIKSQLYTEKSNFDFLVKIKCQGPQFIKTCQNVKLVHQETKYLRFEFEKLKNSNRKIF